ncbi:alpha/beta hydrolase [Herbiconiux sp. KACC 21604]|uniref:alpha/beta hydrolase n=1 Tax=unclassified Herbiconiux TaxID=2618217 RepID=UPI0014923E47|nr:alpha/beta hydrolase [Herbiconiux sp. SALV-R1]QJU52234.1 alpha/beta hydrolase [Herbiconiux sp. SALV-R1]WPO87079.1 alpha/beta hydrolase [Herbiconiux sp. KACC 21604]
MTVPEHVAAYGALPEQIVELYGAAADHGGAGSRGLVVLLHGGFWRSRWDRTHLHPMASALAAAGWTVALPEFRRVGDGGGWPATFDDVRAIVSRVPGLVRERFGETSASPASTVVLVGHSAGGHLALWAAAQESLRASVDRVVSLAGVLDLAEGHRLALSSDAVGELLGGAGSAGFAERLAAADPMRLPVPVDAGVATVLVHGELDDEVPVSFSRGYAERDPRIRFEPLPGVGHYELIDPSSEAWAQVLAALTEAR